MSPPTPHSGTQRPPRVLVRWTCFLVASALLSAALIQLGLRGWLGVTVGASLSVGGFALFFCMRDAAHERRVLPRPDLPMQLPLWSGAEKRGKITELEDLIGTSYVGLSVRLVHCSGWFLGSTCPGRTGLMLHILAHRSGGSGQGAGTVFARDLENELEGRDFSLDPAAVLELARALVGTEMFQRELQIEPEADTSDNWSQFMLDVELNHSSASISCNMMVSSYEGADAASLKELMAQLLTLAGVTDGSLWHDLACRQPPK